MKTTIVVAAFAALVFAGCKSHGGGHASGPSETWHASQFSSTVYPRYYVGPRPIGTTENLEEGRDVAMQNRAYVRERQNNIPAPATEMNRNATPDKQ